jgi:osmotically-inducible protein OsmY
MRNDAPDRRYGYQYGNSRGHRTGYSRDYGGFGKYENRDYGRRGPYPAAGMGADYGGRSDYENRGGDEDVNYGEGDVGYESEGAFYQDMDEPINYENQDYLYGSSSRGQFYGMGPQGYQRSDELITEDVCERLTRHGRVDASNIKIDVQNGEVFLKGTVPDREMKWLAVYVAEDITGVKDVHNEIKVERQNQQLDRSAD